MRIFLILEHISVDYPKYEIMGNLLPQYKNS